MLGANSIGDCSLNVVQVIASVIFEVETSTLLKLPAKSLLGVNIISSFVEAVVLVKLVATRELAVVIVPSVLPHIETVSVPAVIVPQTTFTTYLVAFVTVRI